MLKGYWKFVHMVPHYWTRLPPYLYMVKKKQKNLKSSPEPKKLHGWILVYSIGDLKSTNFVHMMSLGWPLTFLAQRWCWRQRPQMLKFSFKFLKPHYFLTLPSIWFIFGMMIHIGPKFLQYHPHPPRSCQGQGHRLRIFMLIFYVEAFRNSPSPPPQVMSRSRSHT